MNAFRFMVLVYAAFLFSAPHCFAIGGPKKDFTPGYLCTKHDKDFKGFDYPSKIARCTRNVTKTLKRKVAEIYDVDESDWPQYEFDHLIPLCAGGSNDYRNLWPQMLDEAHEKDKLENKICNGLKEGTMTQDEAVDAVWEWFDAQS